MRDDRGLGGVKKERQDVLVTRLFRRLGDEKYMFLRELGIRNDVFFEHD